MWRKLKQPTLGQKTSQRAKKRLNKKKKEKQKNKDDQQISITRKKKRKFDEQRQLTSVNGTIQLSANRSQKLTANKDVWGDKMEDKKEGYIRLMSRNIGGLGIIPGNQKEEELKTWIVNSEVDIIGLQELNINIMQCRDRERIGERMKTPAWEHYRVTTGHNKHYSGKKKHLYGGTMMLAQGQHCHRIASMGADERGLGRWTWFLLSGVDKIKTRIISAYRPCKTNKVTSNGTVYRQHLQYYKDNDIDDCPLQMFDKELLELIRKCIRQREKVILMIDLNEDINQGEFSNKLQRCGLISALRNRHGTNTPPTQHSGSVAIDDIYVTHNVLTGKCGYLPFGEGPGDHRGLFVDVNLQSLIGGEFQKVHRQQARRLISTDVRVSKKFNDLFDAQLQRNNVHVRMEQLNQTCHNPMTQDEIALYEKMDRIQMQAFNYANKRCRKLRQGEVQYVPEIIQVEGRKISLWTLVVRRKAGKHVSTKVIRKLAKKCNINNPMKCTIDEAKNHRREAWKCYKKLKPNSRELRDKWLERLADRISETEGDEKAKFIVRLRRREELKAAHKKIKWARKKGGSEGTKQLTVIDPDSGQGTTITEKDEIERVLMDFNKKKFQGANDTPLIQEPLGQMIGMKAETRFADDILRGAWIPPIDINDATEEFLTEMKIPVGVLKDGAFSADISLEEHVRFWRKARENTQSSMSGMHFGFYKTTAAIALLAQTVLNFIRIPFKTGYATERYSKSLNVSIEKEPGNNKPEKQRTIHFLEAGFAEGCRFIFARRMMHNAKLKKVVPEVQYARKKGKAIDAVLQKVLTLDHFRLTRIPGIGFANDLMNCYDRVAHSAAGMAMRRLGAPTSAVNCLLNTLQNMKHYIRTAYGDSDTFYQGDEGAPLQGGGQGNPAAAPMWTAVSIVILGVLNQLGFGVNIISAISLTVISFSAILFVDDTDLFVSGKSHKETIQSVCRRTQNLVNTWTEALWNSGGALRPDKCWFYAADFTWEGSDWRYTNKNEMNISIMAPDHTGTLEEIKQVNFDQPKETLGVKLRIDGNNSGVYDHLHTSTVTWSEQMQSAFLYQWEAALALMTTISRTWSYPLLVTTMTIMECEKIMIPAFKVILTKMGLNRHLPKVFRYAPNEVGGLGLPNIYDMQGLAKIMAVLYHCGKDTIIGKMIEAQMEICHLHIGVGGVIFDADFDEYNILLPVCWTRSLWEYTFKNDIQLSGPYKSPKLQCQNDQFLMECMLRNNDDRFSKADIKSINKCRIYLQCITLADIFSMDGLRICEYIKKRERNPHRKSIWKWPYQVKPITKDWRQWNRCMEYIWSKFTGTLGIWNENRHQQYQWFYSKETDRVYLKKRTSWEIFYKSARTRTFNDRTHFKSLGGNISDLPKDLTPTSIRKKDGDHIWIDGYRETLTQQIDEGIQHRLLWWKKHLSNTTDESLQLLQHFEVFVNRDEFIRIVKEDKLVLVADGSYHPKYLIGTTAVIVETESGYSVAKGYCKTHGDSGDQSAYRSELMGILLGLTWISEMARAIKEEVPDITFACDNEMAVYKCFKMEDYADVRHTNVDILWAIQHMIWKRKIKINGVHVNGHQSDEECEKNQLARMNMLAHNLATEYMEYCKVSETQGIRKITSVMWNISLAGKIPVSNFEYSIKRHIYQKEMKKYRMSKGSISEEEYEKIHWDAVGKANKSYTHRDRIFSTKLCTGFLPTAGRQHLFDDNKSSRCPCCGRLNETIEHMLSCTNTSVKENRMKEIEKLEKWMESNSTHPDIIHIIINTLKNGFGAKFEHNVPENATIRLRRCARMQDNIGMMNFHRGYLMREWSMMQREHFESIFFHHKKRQTRWAETFITKLNSMNMGIWYHRNSIAAEAKKLEEKHRIQLQTDEEIRQIFNIGVTGIRPVDQSIILDTSVEEVLKLNLQDKQDWISMVNTMRSRYERSVKNSMTNMRTNFENWTNYQRKKGRRTHSSTT